MLAAREGHKEIVEVLIKAGADLNHKVSQSSILMRDCHASPPAVVYGSHVARRIVAMDVEPMNMLSMPRLM